jgi:predicted  nucleic acid-binding Zn-ribbon protein
MDDKIVSDLPRGSVDLACQACGAVYEFYNRRVLNEPNEPPICPACGSNDYKRAYTTVPQIYIRLEHPYAARAHQHVSQRGGNWRPFTDGECQAMATCHMLNTGEYVDWRDIKKEVNTRYIGFNTGKPTSQTQ